MLNNSCSVAGSWILTSVLRGLETSAMHISLIKSNLIGPTATASCQGAHYTSPSRLPSRISQMFLQSRYTAAAVDRQPGPSRTIHTRCCSDLSKAAPSQGFASLVDKQHAGQQCRLHPNASPASLATTALHTASNISHDDMVGTTSFQSDLAEHAVQASVQQLITDISEQQSMLAPQQHLHRSSPEAQPGLSRQPLPVYLPIEVVQIGIDPDTHGAVAVVRTQLHGCYHCCQDNSGDFTASCHVSSSTNTPQQHASSDISMTASRSMHQQRVQAFTGLPAAVRVYDMPAVATTTKSKTCSGKQRVRRRMDIMQSIDLIRQILHDVVVTPLAAAPLPPPSADIPEASSGGNMRQACLAPPLGNIVNSSTSSGHHAKADGIDCKHSPPVVPRPVTLSSMSTWAQQQQLPLQSTMGSSSTSSTNSSSNTSSTTSSSSPSYILLRAAVEESNIQPSNGSFATRSSAYSVGAWTALLAAHGFEVTCAPVRQWKKDMQLLKRSKDCSRQLAQQLYQQAGVPQDHLLRSKNTHGRAEALLIAAWSLGWSATPDLTPLQGPYSVAVSTTAAAQSWDVVHAGDGSNSWPQSSVPAAAAGYATSDDEGSATRFPLPNTTADLSWSSVGLVSRQHLLNQLNLLGSHTEMLDVSSQMVRVQQAVLDKQAARQREKEQRAAARKAAAVQRAAEKAQAKAEQAARRLEQQSKAAARKAAAAQRAAETAQAKAEKQAARCLMQESKAAAVQRIAEEKGA